MRDDKFILQQIDKYLSEELSQEEVDQLWIEFLSDEELYQYFLTLLHLKALYNESETVQDGNDPVMND